MFLGGEVNNFAFFFFHLTHYHKHYLLKVHRFPVGWGNFGREKYGNENSLVLAWTVGFFFFFCFLKSACKTGIISPISACWFVSDLRMYFVLNGLFKLVDIASNLRRMKVEVFVGTRLVYFSKSPSWFGAAHVFSHILLWTLQRSLRGKKSNNNTLT